MGEGVVGRTATAGGTMGGLRGQVLRHARAHLRRSLPRLLVAAVAVAALVTAAEKWLAPTRPWLAGLLVGGALTGYLWWAVWVVWVASGAQQRMRAATAQERTLLALRRAGTQTGWQVVADVPVASEVADLVLVSPAAVVSIGTKWSVQPWVADDLSRACERAATAAAGVERIVQLVDSRLPVRAAIVVWGPAAAGLERQQVPMGRHLVDVVPARELAGWARGLRHGAVPPPRARELADILVAARTGGELTPS